MREVSYIQLFVISLHGSIYGFSLSSTKYSDLCHIINPLAPELFFLILAHTVYKMWIIQEPNKLALW